MIPISLHGLGFANPPDTITQEEALGCARVLTHRQHREASWLKAVYEKSGIATRRQVHGRAFVGDVLNGTRHSDSAYLPTDSANGPTTAVRMGLYAQHAPALAVQASAEALLESRISPTTITHLITVSCTGFMAPGVDCELLTALNLPGTTQRLHVGFMGCHAAINGLRAALAIAQDPANTVLLCAVELSTLHYYYGPETDKVVANALFADGAAAVVLSGRPTPAAHPRLVATGSGLIPDSAGEMAWRIGDHGFEMVLTQRIPTLIEQHLAGWLTPWLAAHNLNRDDVAHWAIHPGGPRILRAAQNALGLSERAMEPSLATFREFGNMSSPTVLFILGRLRQARVTGPTVLLGFGPGLMAEAALLM